MAQQQKIRIFEGVESSLWTLADAPAEPANREQIRPTMLANQAIYTLLAESYPKPLTVFEITVDLLRHWKAIPVGNDDQHSTVYKLLERGKPRFVELSTRPVGR